MKAKIIDSNSPSNQMIKRDFVKREIKGNLTLLINSVLQDYPSDALFTYADIENFCKYSEYEGHFTSFYTGSEEDRQICISKLKDKLQELSDKEPNNSNQSNISVIEQEIEDLENLEQIPQEIYEWWLVSDYLGDKLREKGQPVLFDGYNIYWGRTTTGQAILLDSVISEICNELDLLK